MLDFWASGADGVTVRLVTDFVVVFRMAGGLPSLALVATGDELRNVFMVAVVQAPAGLPSLYERGCRRVSLALLSSGGASLWERVPPVYALEFGASLAEFGAGGPYGAPGATRWAAEGLRKPQGPASRAAARPGRGAALVH